MGLVEQSKHAHWDKLAVTNVAQASYCTKNDQEAILVIAAQSLYGSENILIFKVIQH